MSDPLPRRTATGKFITHPQGAQGSTERAPARVVWLMALAQFGLFVGLLAPVTVSLALKAQTIVPDAEAAPVTGLVLGVAALIAMVMNPIVGRLSDLTLSRFGRRRPWMIAGALGFVVAMLVVALAPNVPVLLLGWILGQLTGNMVLAPLIATIADQVPPAQRGSVSANVGVMQQLGILAAAYIASAFVTNMLLLFLIPAAFVVVLVVAYCVVLPDRPLEQRPDVGGWMALVKTFWVNPVAHPNFAWVWISRFLLTLANFFFVAFRIPYMQQDISLGPEEAATVLAIGTTIYTAVLVVAAKFGGWISDRTGMRKPFVIGATLVMAVGFAGLSVTDNVAMFYLMEAIMGLGYGVYVAVDMALVVDVLPNPEDAAKDMGVLNIANALPQSLAGLIGGALLAATMVDGQNNFTMLFILATVVAVLGALTIIPVKQKRIPQAVAGEWAPPGDGATSGAAR